MEYIEKFRKVAVLGAAGKMGSGILLLTAMEMAELKLQNKNLKAVLYAIDVSADGLAGLLEYIESQVIRAAEKKTVVLRKLYADREDLIENGDVISQYAKDVLAMVRTSSHLSDAYGSSLVFEAIKEDPKLKVTILKEIDLNSEEKPWYFTNTSSIPIGELNQDAELDGRVIGFHFYNPPAVQRLVELIPSDQTLPELTEFAKNYAKKLRKVLIPSNDFAGFIGNGHFMRDALYGIQEVEKLSDEMGFPTAIWVINKLSQEFLIRPMGIFQLVDYVGIDVVSYIMGVMNPYLENENLYSQLLEDLLAKGVRGGQFSNGSQKDGFFKYERGRPSAIFDINTGEYAPLDEANKAAGKFLGSLPEAFNWKQVNFSPKKNELLENFFKALGAMNTTGARMAKAYGLNSKAIGELLLNSNVAATEKDVNKVLETGFFHAYGPINNYFN
ncbi:MAG: 3-hydroxyacyl-CoA dehydrogenase family protein [Bacteroidota bacterium]|nr:3-hydroxyacyl-CoA dehydrogenase family protein [Bacteroidota bacterium]